MYLRTNLNIIYDDFSMLSYNHDEQESSKNNVRLEQVRRKCSSTL